MLKRRVVAVLAAMVLAGGAALVGPAPAQAHPQPGQGGTLRGVYYDGQHCQTYGTYGVQNGMWDWYYCELHTDYGGLWFLWSFDYV